MAFMEAVEKRWNKQVLQPAKNATKTLTKNGSEEPFQVTINAGSALIAAGLLPQFFYFALQIQGSEHHLGL